MEDRERLDAGVVAGVVAERPLRREVALLDVALEHDLRVRGHLEVDRLATDELDRLSREESGEHELVDVLRQRRGRGVGRHRIEPERDRDLEPAVGREVVHAPVLVDLPVHRGLARAEHLHAVHADVARAVARVARDDGGKRDERRRVLRPAGLDRKPAQVDVVAGEDDLLRAPGADALRHRVRDRLELGQALDLLDETLRGLHLQHVAEAGTDFVQARGVEGETHAALGAELVDQQWDARSP